MVLVSLDADLFIRTFIKTILLILQDVFANERLKDIIKKQDTLKINITNKQYRPLKIAL